MPTQSNTTKIPAPLYAAAGAGDLAYEQLRRLPDRVAELRERAAELRPMVTEAVSENNLRADLDRLRKVARRNANALVSGAATVYSDLVARGERAVRRTRTTRAAVKVAPVEGTVTTEVTTAAERPARKSNHRSPATKSPASRTAATKSAPTKRAAGKR